MNGWKKEELNLLLTKKTRSKKSVYKGLPQGGVISPTLYALHTKDINKGINFRTKVLQYADDIAIYFTDKNLLTAVNILEQSVRLIRNNLEKIGLKLESEKTF